MFWLGAGRYADKVLSDGSSKYAGPKAQLLSNKMSDGDFKEISHLFGKLFAESPPRHNL